MTRIHFAEDEARYSWLPPLLDAYAVVDEGVALAVGRKEKKDATALACRRGCDTCCRTQTDIPTYPHELTGIYWYAIEKIRQPTREVLKHRLAGHEPGGGCPLLMDGTCVIHPLRPAGCRQFNVFAEPCAEGEDPFHTRRTDVLTPPRAVIHRAYSLVLSFYGVGQEAAGKTETVEKLIRAQVVNLTACDWKKLAARMHQFDSKASRSGEAG